MSVGEEIVETAVSEIIQSRRGFLKRMTASAAAISCSSWLSAQEYRAVLHVSGTIVGTMPDNFTGLSYESSSLHNPTFFSSKNSTLVNHFQTLGSHGVLRIGGNSSELTSWQSPSRDATHPLNSPTATKQSFSITPAGIEGLATFLKAINWQLIYGLNLVGGDIDSAIEEAACVLGTIGDQVIALQLGNEPDLIAQSGRWTYEGYIAKWKQYHNAIRTRLPAARFAGPDTSYKHDWSSRFAADTAGEITLLTTHYYAGGPPSDPELTTDHLLHTDKRFEGQVLPDIQTARQNHVPYRMTEGNTCYSGGKAGVSSTFASALWVADFMLALASAGCSGVNLHGGGDGLYTPIAGSTGRGFRARPIYYGMLVARQFLGSKLLETDLSPGGSDLKAYASAVAGERRVLVINRGAIPLVLKLIFQRLNGRRTGTLCRLQAPSLSSEEGVTFADASVSSDGLFTPSRGDTLIFNDGEGALHLDPYSAALVSVK